MHLGLTRDSHGCDVMWSNSFNGRNGTGFNTNTNCLYVICAWLSNKKYYPNFLHCWEFNFRNGPHLQMNTGSTRQPFLYPILYLVCPISFVYYTCCAWTKNSVLGALKSMSPSCQASNIQRRPFLCSNSNFKARATNWKYLRDKKVIHIGYRT